MSGKNNGQANIIQPEGTEASGMSPDTSPDARGFVDSVMIMISATIVKVREKSRKDVLSTQLHGCCRTGTVPHNFKAYVEACQRGEMKPGKIMTFRRAASPPRWIFNFPTRRHWRDPAQLMNIAAGLQHLREVIPDCEISSVGIPALGGGLEGLRWKDVFPLVVTYPGDLPDVSIFVPRPDEQTNGTGAGTAVTEVSV